MRLTSKNQTINFSAKILASFCLLVLYPNFFLQAADPVGITDYPPNSSFEESADRTNDYFMLIETREINAQKTDGQMPSGQLLDDQMLEMLSPALVAPIPIKISALQLRQRALEEFHHSVCFKRCHTTNDFSTSDYTSEQWCRLIEKDGHSIFCKIPWEDSESKNQLLKYLINNAKNIISETEGIGIWNYPKDSVRADTNAPDK